MSLSRAFTTKLGTSKRPDISAPLPHRSLTTKHSFSSGTIRNKISGPVELLSTTNMQSYNAPDIYQSSTASNSGDESVRLSSSASTPPTSPDSSSMASSPPSPEPNHLSRFFDTSSRQSNPANPIPAIPHRASSHSLKSHEILSRKRSMSRPSPNNSISRSRSSTNMFGANVETVDGHPFGELAQVSELAEEYGTQEKIQVIDEEEQDLLSRGLFKFGAEDYMNEIHGLFLSTFGESRPAMSSMWI